MIRKPSRPRDTNELATMIGRIATHDAEKPEDVAPPVDPKATKRGVARAEKLSPEQRKEIAQKAANTRWQKGRKRP